MFSWFSLDVLNEKISVDLFLMFSLVKIVFWAKEWPCILLLHCRNTDLSHLQFVFTFQLFTDGITNKLIGCYVGDTTDDVVLVRIYGNKTELLVDRDEEVKSFRVLQAHGCAPQLYCTFNNGLCYEFMQGEALDPEHVCNPDIFR